MRGIHASLLFGSVLLAFASAAACGTTDDSTFADGKGDGGGSSGNGEGGSSSSSGFTTNPGDGSTPSAQPIAITPTEQVVTFVAGQPAPTVQFVAKIVATGEQVPAVFSIDRGEIGSVGVSTGLFTASGGAGGVAKITAAWNGVTTSTTVAVKLKVVDNGAAPVGDAGGGAGGNGGVGGDGSGGIVTPDLVAVLKGTPVGDPGLTPLYPYDGTVWPRGILAPLLMWTPGAQANYDALLIKIQEANFEYEGTFAKNHTPFRNHAIPQQAWKQMLSSNQGEEVTVTLVFAKGTTAYGPITLKWKVASAPLKGTVYYNSYGTSLAKNYDGPHGRFGGATLAIKGGSTEPTLVAGGTGDISYCRVCHSVAANGSVLITQRGDGNDRRFSTYDLKTEAETEMTPEDGNAAYAWPAIYPDGSIFLSDSSEALGSTTAPNKLYQVVSGGGKKAPTPIATPSWPAGFQAAFPAFSPDGKRIAFTKFGGGTGADKRTLAFMPFDKATNTFGAMTELYRPPTGTHSALYPAFLPTNDALVFHVETRNNTRDYGGTRSDDDVSPPDAKASRGTHAELWWVNANGASPIATRLDRLNGKNAVPVGPAGSGHEAGEDETLNYEPTVNPVPSGGYAWVVFTSRRLYGNVATINPFHSDPRYHNLTATPTPKKLWVAAIDLNAAPGTDPSHPAFYLPAQELLAGNSRGYWVVDPCKSDSSECETGDECCGGFCRPDQAGKLVCSNAVPTCAQEFEKCTTSADCCSELGLSCINGRCAAPAPPK